MMVETKEVQRGYVSRQGMGVARRKGREVMLKVYMVCVGLMYI